MMLRKEELFMVLKKFLHALNLLEIPKHMRMTKIFPGYGLFLLFYSLGLSFMNGQSDRIPQTNVSFTKIQLLDKYVTEGASIGDLDMDGQVDVIAGPVWWKGPGFKEVFAYAPVKHFPITGPNLEGYSDNFFTFPGHFDNDEYTDILRVGLPGTDSKWIKNPGKKLKQKKDSLLTPTYHNALKGVCHESPSLINVIGDEKKELVAFSNGYLVLGIAPTEGERDWKILPISTKDKDKFKTYSHGLGAGDINMDGLTDILERSGWWEQPKKWDKKSPWRYHQFLFSPGTGGAQMFGFDVDGDGDNDVVTAMNAHGYGLSWFEQIEHEEKLGFKEHVVMTDKPEDNFYGVSFSQLHAMTVGDIDNDGVEDIVTGKCYYAHNGRDPGAEDPAVLYWFKTLRLPDGTVELVPYIIDDDSGVGRQISTGDLNDDGKIDIVVGNKKGVFIFMQN